MITIHIRFYEELNDFLTPDRYKRSFDYAVSARTAIKDVIESLGVPHTKVDLILVNHQSVDFSYQVQAGDDISVYPVFEAIDISNIIRLRPEPLRNTRFILDVHLGKLARRLRLLGFDTLYQNDYSDQEIIQHSKEKRIILTRDIGLLKNKSVTHGHWVRQTLPEQQVIEVLSYFDLYQKCAPLTRCMDCNGVLEQTNKIDIEHRLPPSTRKLYMQFKQCSNCKKIYWEGAHYHRIVNWIEKIMLTR